jgi:hypothetical protein
MIHTYSFSVNCHTKSGIIPLSPLSSTLLIPLKMEFNIYCLISYLSMPQTKP